MDDYTNVNRFEKKADTKAIEKKEVQKVANGVVKKKTKWQKFTNLVKPDVENLGSYILTEVVVPTGKELVSDMVHAFLYGGSTPGRKRSTAEKVSYRSYYDKKQEPASVKPSGYKFDDIMVNSKEEADAVLSALDDIISQFGRASVADLYDLVDISGDYTNHNYGWTNISTAKAVRVRGGGYMLQLPRAIVLDR